jgi:hypothetical protein
MTKRLEQSRGPHDSRWAGRLHAVSEMPPPLDEPEEPTNAPPTLTLVGGTDITPTDLEPIATPGS